MAAFLGKLQDPLFVCELLLSLRFLWKAINHEYVHTEKPYRDPDEQFIVFSCLLAPVGLCTRTEGLVAYPGRLPVAEKLPNRQVHPPGDPCLYNSEIICPIIDSVSEHTRRAVLPRRGYLQR